MNENEIKIIEDYHKLCEKYENLFWSNREQFTLVDFTETDYPILFVNNGNLVFYGAADCWFNIYEYNNNNN